MAKNKTFGMTANQLKAAKRAQAIAKSKAKLRNKTANQKVKRDIKQSKKMIDPNLKAKQMNIAERATHMSNITGTVTANIQGSEAQKTERARISADALARYSSAINGNVGQTGDVNTGDNPTNTAGSQVSQPGVMDNWYN